LAEGSFSKLPSAFPSEVKFFGCLFEGLSAKFASPEAPRLSLACVHLNTASVIAHLPEQRNSPFTLQQRSGRTGCNIDTLEYPAHAEALEA